MRTIRELQSTVPQVGRVEAILVRPGRREDPVRRDRVTAVVGAGLDGDRHRPSRHGTSGRQVTLIQAEHLAVVAALLGRDTAVDPALLRRNIVVSGVPLTALKGLRFHIGDAVLEGTGVCHPCSRMEEALGPGGYQAVRGHGGITAAVLEGGAITVGAPLVVVSGLVPDCDPTGQVG